MIFDLSDDDKLQINTTFSMLQTVYILMFVFPSLWFFACTLCIWTKLEKEKEKAEQEDKQDKWEISTKTRKMQKKK